MVGVKTGETFSFSPQIVAAVVVELGAAMFMFHCCRVTYITVRHCVVGSHQVRYLSLQYIV